MMSTRFSGRLKFGWLGRLNDSTRNCNDLDSARRILREIEAFVGTADQHDDMTMIVMKIEQVGAAQERVAV